MSKHAEKKETRQAELRALHSKAEAEFMNIPDVVGVGFGYKEVDGKITDEVSFRVYVKEKKNLKNIPKKNRIPSAFEGIPTDVLIVPEIELEACRDLGSHSELMSGIRIARIKAVTVGVSSGFQISTGTIGFLANANELDAPENVVLVSNNHVLGEFKAVSGDRVFVPPLEMDGPHDVKISKGYHESISAAINASSVGKIHKLGQEANYNYTYQGETAAKDYFVDCTTASLNISISSWCGTNCGEKYKNHVRLLNIGGDSQLKGVERVPLINPRDTNPDPVYKVYKTGYRTSKTTGKVIDTVGVGTVTLMGTNTKITAKNLIIVVPDGPDCDGFMRFSAKGDSGAAIVNGDNKLVGLLFGSIPIPSVAAARKLYETARENAKKSNTPTNQTALATASASLTSAEQSAASTIKKTIACHIHPVLEYLDVTPITTENPPVGPAGITRSNIHGSFIDEIDETIALRDLFLSTPRGANIYNTVLKHRNEVVKRVNSQRRVTIAWYRNEGPLLMSHLVNNARNRKHKIPFDFNGIDRRQVFENLADVMLQHGSDELRSDIIKNRTEVMSWIDGFDDLHEFVEQFETLPVPKQELADA